ncbi:formate dehydrogenase accessory sulfurtransferase FdhD [Anaeromyxobacter paludicola]|uniref:Sulfur carrier protein FdhD n=1 Tax=Anaeromyxobacter paludicola TaxID=2918171 RepID=A0ABM7XF96_9BACT|nr:formate dehydrogenase accessory sulfurtransferase FdhD [Anaeromyxobacter paludicola]BDG10545.1 sulfurtransferase FdhD [Anaeromyxobacter paludicola]
MSRPPLPRGAVERKVLRLGRGAPEELLDAVAEEEPLEIRVDGEAVAVTMRTPGHDGELSLGFLFAEGMIASAADVGSAAHCGRPGEEGYGNVIDVRSAAGQPIVVERVLESRRWAVTTSACGVCGRQSVDGLVQRCGVVGRAVRLAPEVVSTALAALARSQPVFARTGGLHGAAAFDASGRLLAAREDVGRHNAVDKVVGWLLREGRLGAGGEGAPALLAVSGRSSFELVQKAAAAGIPVLAGVSAPSSLAVDLAERAGVTLVGFVRGAALNVYAHAERIAVPPPA